MESQVLILTYLILCVLVGVFAHQRRNRNGGGYFVLSLVISPILGFILVACLQTLSDRPRQFDDIFGSRPAKRDPRWEAMRSEQSPTAPVHASESYRDAMWRRAKENRG
jgi:hypothetical protein